MTALTLQRTSAAKAGWVIGLLFFAWLAFLFVPIPKSPPKEVTPPPPLPPSKLRVVGLSDNPDWDGLPELFAALSESAQWKDDKTQFAYWHPGNRAYTYYFDATRKNGKTRFHSLGAGEAVAGREFREDGSYYVVTEPSGRIQLPEPNFESESPTHPFIFFREIKRPLVLDQMPLRNPVILDPATAPPQVTIEPAPKTKLEETPMPDDPQRK